MHHYVRDSEAGGTNLYICFLPGSVRPIGSVTGSSSGTESDRPGWACSIRTGSMAVQKTIALVGSSGSMGRQIAEMAPDYGCEIAYRFDAEHPLTSERLSAAARPDAAIDFTRPDAVRSNAETLLSCGVPTVVGTTGWEAQAEEIFRMVGETGGRLLYASNFSVGLQTFARIVRSAARLVDRIDAYDVALHEDHHVRKVDSPSGTARTLAEIVLEEVARKERMEIDRAEGRIDPASLHVTSRRVGETVGTHTITIDSAADTIELTHRARNRTGFAAGALLAAVWLPAQPPGIYRFDDVFEQIIASS